MKIYTIAEVEEELRVIDGRIKTAIDDQDLDEATRLEGRKRLLPEMLLRMREREAELQRSVVDLCAKAAEKKKAFDDVQALCARIAAQIEELSKQAPDSETYIQTQYQASSSESAVNNARRELQELRG